MTSAAATKMTAKPLLQQPLWLTVAGAEQAVFGLDPNDAYVPLEIDNTIAARLENGVATPFELLQVEEDVSEAEAREIRARVDYEVARVSLELARGTLLTSRALDGLIEAE